MSSEKFWKLPDNPDDLKNYRGPIAFDALVKLSAAEDLSRIVESLEEIDDVLRDIRNELKTLTV